jgi:hypothetical protein
MSKVIAPIHPKWMYWPDDVAHIYKLGAIFEKRACIKEL